MNHYFITGASKGIGKALAEELLTEKDNHVTGISRTRSIRAENYRHFALDLSTHAAAAAFEFEAHPEARLLTLVNNAATLGEVRHLGSMDDDAIAQAFNVNITAPAILMNRFIKKFRTHPAKKIIINLTSGAAQSAYDGWSLYCAGKAAIDMFSRVAAVEQELEKSGINVFAIAPGVVDTDMQTAIRNTNERDFSRRQKFIALHEEQQLYSPQAVAKIFADLIRHPEKINDVVHRIML